MKLAIESRWTQIINSHDYSLLIQAGVILAATGDAGCIELFDQAAQVAETDSGAYAAHHRAAAYFTKRQHDISSAESRLKLALSFATGEEKYVNIALMKNLDALIQVKAGREAINYLREAEANLNRYLSKPHLTGEQISRAARYRSQVAINMAQLLLAIGETQEALAVMLDNIHSARDTTFDYLDEALGEASYTAYLAKNYTLAVSLGAEAFWRTYSKGSVEAMRSIREIVSAASLKEGKNEYAEYVANTIDNDPLGLQGLSNTLGNTGLR
jgi:hypothetical protein